MTRHIRRPTPAEFFNHSVCVRVPGDDLVARPSRMLAWLNALDAGPKGQGWEVESTPIEDGRGIIYYFKREEDLVAFLRAFSDLDVVSS